jgi:hypothetical protein
MSLLSYSAGLSLLGPVLARRRGCTESPSNHPSVLLVSHSNIHAKLQPDKIKGFNAGILLRNARRAEKSMGSS